MATTHPLPAQTGNPVRGPQAAPALEPAREEALVAAPQGVIHAPFALGGAVAGLPVELDVAVPVREFRVRNLLALEVGQVIETRWVQGEDLPLSAGDVQLAWSEFELVETTLAVRLTRLA